jgi:hypothetical protein
MISKYPSNKKPVVIHNRAMRVVWEDYSDEMERRELTDYARDALDNCTDAESLDSALFAILQEDLTKQRLWRAVLIPVPIRESEHDWMNLLADQGEFDHAHLQRQGFYHDGIRALEGDRR